MTQGGGSPWLTLTLLLLCVPGCWSLSGPNTVTGSVGESLSIQCRYEEKYKTFGKYWCRQPCIPRWHQIVRTGGPEEEMRSGRVSITDHSGDLTFTVALENLTAGDAGKYRCGVSTMLKESGIHGFLPEPFFQVTVLVSPGARYTAGDRVPGLSTLSSAPTAASSTEKPTGIPDSPRSLAGSTRPSRQQGSQFDSFHFLLFLFPKVPLLLGLLGALLWVNRSQKASRGKMESPQSRACQPPMSMDTLSKDTAPQTT